MKSDFKGWSSAPPAWITLRGGNDEGGIVLSSRVRLARNLKGLPYPHHCPTALQKKALDLVFSVLKGQEVFKAGTFMELKYLAPFEREFLVERHLISLEHARSSGERGLAVGANETLAVMVNEEDHIRAASFQPGLGLTEAWKILTGLETQLMKQMDPAYREDFGHLTACPTNMGTGLRASCLLHLPALVISGKIRTLLNEMAVAGLTARGFYGEGTDPWGDLFQVSNNQTLGKSEEQLIGEVERAVKFLAELERKESQSLMNSTYREAVEDRVARAVGTLRAARLLSFPEAMHHLSMARWGLRLEQSLNAKFETVTHLLFLSQPLHIQMRGIEESEAGEEAARSRIIRKQFGQN